MLDLDHAQTVQMIVLACGFLASQLTALVVRQRAASALKGAVVLVLSTLAGVLPTIAWADGATFAQYVVSVFWALTAASLTHYIGAAKALATRTADFGLEYVGRHRKEG